MAFLRCAARYLSARSSTSGVAAVCRGWCSPVARPDLAPGALEARATLRFLEAAVAGCAWAEVVEGRAEVVGRRPSGKADAVVARSFGLPARRPSAPAPCSRRRPPGGQRAADGGAAGPVASHAAFAPSG